MDQNTIHNKSEQAPLFAPEENAQYAHGAPNQSDFIAHA